MHGSLFTFVVLRLLLAVSAAPASIKSEISQYPIEPRSSSYWVANVERQGIVAYGDSSFQIFRNVMDFGAKGDGVTDDTNAINSAISTGNRCGQGCDSSTLTPALVYFPPGTYLVSSPLIQYYYTQLVGDAVTVPTLKAAAGFSGIAVIDADPYTNTGANWYTNQNNFYRQVRNFVIDLTSMPESSGAGIHWQVAQATSLQNIRFEMVQGGGDSNKQIGIFMDNGSGNFLSDLVFNGGNYGAFLGNQQFTSRNLTFNNCNTAIFMNWNWVWALKSITVNNCGIAVDMSNDPTDQTVGSVLLQDSTITNTPIGVLTAFITDSVSTTNGTLVIDNVQFNNCPVAVQGVADGNTILAGNTLVQSWAQGKQYVGTSGTRIQETLTPPSKPSVLLASDGSFYERSKPQYETYPASSFVSVKAAGAKGDGSTDDTAAIQAAMDSVTPGQILYFDHGAYIISSTIKVPNNIIMTGEIWPLIMARGSAFQDQNNPTPVFQIGNPGDVGAVEMSDLIFETVGPQAGAILLQWNIGASSQGSNGMWDVHFRIGGSAGTQLQSNTCAKNPTATGYNADCIGAFLLLHITSTASVYVENMWAWVADHELDLADHNQIDIYNGRGVYIESTVGVWMYGTSVEHSVLFNYGLSFAENVYMSMIQTETPYFQSNPDATVPFTVNTNFLDPTFGFCASGDESCKKSWGLKMYASSNILVYGLGMYSFFDNYDQTCLATESCQENMIHVQQSSDISLYGLSTVGGVNMVTIMGVSQAKDADNRNNFAATLALWTDIGA